MPSVSKLDLCGIAWPASLLKFKSAINDLCASDVLVVLARDPDVVDNIIMIVNHSENMHIRQQKSGKLFRLSVEKGG